jgi:hypothetical protein
MHAGLRSAVVGVIIAFVSVTTQTSPRQAIADNSFLWHFAAGG